MLMQAADTIIFPGLANPVSGGVQGAGASNDGGILDLIFGQLLCSRLCHDLIGPTAAINAGEELIRDGDDGEEAHDLIAESARLLTARLSFFRALFSPAGSAATGMNAREARALVEDFLIGSRVTLDWAAGAADDRITLHSGSARLLLGLAMLATDALPRGGRVHIRLRRHRGELRLEMNVTGPRVHLPSDILQALKCQDAGGLSARTIHAFHLSQLIRRTGATLSIDADEGEALRMDLRIPGDEAGLAA